MVRDTRVCRDAQVVQQDLRSLRREAFGDRDANAVRVVGAGYNHDLAIELRVDHDSRQRPSHRSMRRDHVATIGAVGLVLLAGLTPLLASPPLAQDDSKTSCRIPRFRGTTAPGR